MTSSRRERCRAGFAPSVPEWIRDDKSGSRPRDFDRCRRQRGHPRAGGHTPDCGGAYDDNGKEIHQNSQLWFSTHVRDWHNGLNVWASKEYIEDIKGEIRRLVKA